MTDSGMLLTLSDAEAERVLRACDLFETLTEATFSKVNRLARVVRYSRGDTIFREGRPCPGIFVVARGMVRVFKLAPSGKEHVLRLAGPGRSFGEVAVFGDFPCPANAEAVEDCACVLVSRTMFRKVLEADHAFCLEMIGGLALRVRRFVDLLEDLVLRDSTARVARHLILADTTEGRGGFRLTVRKKDLASHLNLTSETLSRTLRRLAECGLIEMHEHDLRIRDLDRLRQVAAGGSPTEDDGPAPTSTA